MSELRYKRLAYVALRVTDLARSCAFQREVVGLIDGPAAPPGMAFLRASDKHHDLLLIEAGEPGFERLAFEMESAAELNRARAHFTARGLAPVDVPAAELAALGVTEAFRFREPNSGLTLELLHHMAAANTPYAPTVTKIARLGHVVLNTTEPAAARAFFEREMNFRVSDEVDGAVTFMRCFPNPLHHSFALSKSTENKLHHVNFMVTDMDDIGSALFRLKRHNVPIVYGPGRHPPSGSIFLYFLDPDGMTFEFSFGMEEFAEHGARAPRVLPFSLKSLDYWDGDAPDKRFASVGKVVA